MSEVLEGFDGLGQVAVELGHAGGEERVDDGAREEAAQVCLEETEHLGFVGLSGNSVRKQTRGTVIHRREARVGVYSANTQ